MMLIFLFFVDIFSPIFFLRSNVSRREVIIRFVDLGRVDYHHCEIVLVGPVLLIFIVFFCCPIMSFFRSKFLVVMFVTISA